MESSARPVHPGLRAWLQAPGSLTLRLRRHGEVRVKLLFQGSRRLWPQEQQELGCAAGHVREVLLLLDGRPAVWARSALAHAALAGPWRALLGLGTRPLAELLFGAHALPRSALQVHRLPPLGLPGGHWLCAGAVPAPRWGRSSVFLRRGQPLRVFEAFYPWMHELALK